MPGLESTNEVPLQYIRSSKFIKNSFILVVLKAIAKYPVRDVFYETLFYITTSFSLLRRGTKYFFSP